MSQEKNHLNRLIGYMNAGDIALINGDLFEAVAPVNVYVQASKFLKLCEDAGFDDDSIRVSSLTSWLTAQGYLKSLTASEVGLISNLENYRTYPYFPSYKDILWVVRVLKQIRHELTPRNVYLLAVYKEMEILTHDVKSIIISRDSQRIRGLIQILENAYQKHVEIFMNNNGKEIHNESGSDRIPVA